MIEDRPSGFAFFARQMGQPIFPMLRVENIEVNPDFRRRGIGTAAMCLALKKGVESGAKTAFLRVAAGDAEQKRLVQLYESHGFLLLKDEVERDYICPHMWHPLETIGGADVNVRLKKYENDDLGFVVLEEI